MAYFQSIEQVRFDAVSSCHTRRMHFYTTAPSAINYFTSGIGAIDELDFKARVELLDGHTANLPMSADSFSDGFGDLALLKGPFFKDGVNTFDIDVWGMDDAPAADCSVHYTIWVRSYSFGSVHAPAPPPSGKDGTGVPLRCLKPQCILAALAHKQLDGSQDLQLSTTVSITSACVSACGRMSITSSFFFFLPCRSFHCCVKPVQCVGVGLDVGASFTLIIGILALRIIPLFNTGKHMLALICFVLAHIPLTLPSCKPESLDAS